MEKLNEKFKRAFIGLTDLVHRKSDQDQENVTDDDLRGTLQDVFKRVDAKLQKMKFEYDCGHRLCQENHASVKPRNQELYVRSCVDGRYFYFKLYHLHASQGKDAVEHCCYVTAHIQKGESIKSYHARTNVEYRVQRVM